MLDSSKFIAESRQEVARGWGKGPGELLSNGHRVSFWDEMDSGDDCTTLCMCLLPLNCTFTRGKLYVMYN